MMILKKTVQEIGYGTIVPLYICGARPVAFTRCATTLG